MFWIPATVIGIFVFVWGAYNQCTGRWLHIDLASLLYTYMLTNAGFAVLCVKLFNDPNAIEAMIKASPTANSHHAKSILKLCIGGTVSDKDCDILIEKLSTCHSAIILKYIALHVYNTYTISSHDKWLNEWMDRFILVLSKTHPSNVNPLDALLFSELLQRGSCIHKHRIHLNGMALFASRMSSFSHMNVWLVLGSITIAYRKHCMVIEGGESDPLLHYNTELVSIALNNLATCIAEMSNTQSVSCAVAAFVTLLVATHTRCMFDVPRERIAAKIKSWGSIRMVCIGLECDEYWKGDVERALLLLGSM